jgi:hypothetical protein
MGEMHGIDANASRRTCIIQSFPTRTPTALHPPGLRRLKSGVESLQANLYKQCRVDFRLVIVVGRVSNDFRDAR